MKLPSSKLDVRLIALDLDDTLLDSNRQISDKNVQVLQECVRRGIYVVLCSGRAEDGILPFVRRLDIAGSEFGKFIIAINGCSVFDMHERRQIFTCSVKQDILLQADSEAEKMGLKSEVYSPDTIFYAEENSWTRIDVDMCGLKGKTVENYRDFLRQGNFPKMLIPGEPETLQILQKKLKENFGESAVVFTSKPFFLEILPPGCGKGESIRWLADHIGIPYGTTMGFGDSMNDESMIEKCGYGVCMSNGIDYIKNAADFITQKSNDESGVGDFIEKFVL
ncbi:Cof-type HAD-IIB family hydrolase [Treponema sp.]|uniref:Cof-type HAD-IIB family hydrolase n=1 Tax=Treponema sp. TaxID=166 RepID=UPI003F05B111